MAARDGQSGSHHGTPADERTRGLWSPPLPRRGVRYDRHWYLRFRNTYYKSTTTTLAESLDYRRLRGVLRGLAAHVLNEGVAAPGGAMPSGGLECVVCYDNVFEDCASNPQMCGSCFQHVCGPCYRKLEVCPACRSNEHEYTARGRGGRTKQLQLPPSSFHPKDMAFVQRCLGSASDGDTSRRKLGRW